MSKVIGLMALNLATLNARGRSDGATVQEAHFTCAADYRLLENDYVVFSAYGSRSNVGASLLIGRSLNADVLADDEDRMVVSDVARI